MYAGNEQINFTNQSGQSGQSVQLGSGNGIALIPSIPLLPTSNVSVGFPVQDPIFGTTGYMQGPPINLFPNNIYGQKKLTVSSPTANVNIYGNIQQLIQ